MMISRPWLVSNRPLLPDDASASLKPSNRSRSRPPINRRRMREEDESLSEHQEAARTYLW